MSRFYMKFRKKKEGGSPAFRSKFFLYIIIQKNPRRGASKIKLPLRQKTASHKTIKPTQIIFAQNVQEKGRKRQ